MTWLYYAATLEPPARVAVPLGEFGAGLSAPLRRAGGKAGLIGIAAVALIASPAHAQRSDVSPYIEVGQVLTTDFQDGDVLTYSTVAAGIDASVHTRRVQIQASYQYQRRISYDDRLADDDIHSGIARAQVVVAPGFTMEAGAIAARARADVRGDAPGNLTGNVRNVSQVYSAYAGPSVSTHVGPMFVNGAYRFGYTKVESPDIPSPIAGQPPLDVYDDSKVHVATASVGVKSGTVLPVGLTASGSYTREEAGQLDQRFEGKYARGDVVLPVGRGLALTAGAGYEKIEISQRDPLLDVGGDPVVDGAGRQVTDPASPRRLAYDFDGIYWDAGVIYRPSSRTFLEARVGKRYGSMSYTGSLSYKIGPASGLQIGVYDSIDSFGRQLGGGLASLPTEFMTGDDPFGDQYNGCVFGSSGNAAGGCMNAVFASVPTANYRSRGVNSILALSRGPNRIGVGAGYSRRTFLAPSTPGGIQVNGTSDEAFFGQAFASRALGRNATIGANAFASYFNSDLPDADGVLGWGANGIYTHRFGGLGATAAVGVYGFEGQDSESNVAASAMFGLRYGF